MEEEEEEEAVEQKRTFSSRLDSLKEEEDEADLADDDDDAAVPLPLRSKKMRRSRIWRTSSAGVFGFDLKIPFMLPPPPQLHEDTRVRVGLRRSFPRSERQASARGGGGGGGGASDVFSRSSRGRSWERNEDEEAVALRWAALEKLQPTYDQVAQAGGGTREVNVRSLGLQAERRSIVERVAEEDNESNFLRKLRVSLDWRES